MVQSSSVTTKYAIGKEKENSEQSDKIFGKQYIGLQVVATEEVVKTIKIF